MIYCFDIDGTLCTNTDGAYEAARPFRERIAKVNALYRDGHTIYLLTARGATTGIDWRTVTERQMGEWGLQYHALYFGKPTADIYVDDRAVTDREWFGDS
jgi:outer membrane protein assembly factor BamB